MSDPHETLARSRAQADAAAPGPWYAEPVGRWRNGAPYSSVVEPGLYDVAEHCPPGDAEFIAAARTTVPALLDALEKVLELHQPVGEEVIPWDCAEGDCDHEDDEHPLDTATLCGECYRLAVEVSPYYGENGCSAILWPCPTVKAITDALDTNH